MRIPVVLYKVSIGNSTVFYLRFFVLFFLLLTGCIQSISRTPAIESREWKDLVDGIRLYEDRKYSEATEAFLRIIDSYPGTPLLVEAQWLLAKSYDASGRRGSAVGELRIFLKNFPESPHQEEALAFLFRLENSPQKIIAAHWALDPQKLPADSFAFYKKRGINTIIISIPDVSGPETVSQKSFLDWIEAAHRAGFQVMIKAPLREAAGMLRLRPEWRDQQFDSIRRQLQPIAKLDLFNSGVKEGLLQIFRDFAHYPIDGIYVDSFAYRMDEGWTVSAAELYQNLFLERLDPLLFLSEPFRSAGGERPAPAVSQFWHWVGWRSRFINSLLKDIQKAVESVRPGIRFGVALPEVVLFDPVKGLAELSLDILELKRSKFDFYFLTSKAEVLPVAVVSDILSRYSIPPQEVWLQWMLKDDSASHFSRLPFQGFVLLNP